MVTQTNEVHEGVSRGNQDSDSVAEKAEDEGNISDESTNEDDGDDESTIAELVCMSSLISTATISSHSLRDLL